MVLVTGATGVIGPALVAKLLSKGYSVRVLVRQVPPVGLLPQDSEVLVGDIQNDRAVQEAVKDVGFVFHLAAKLHDAKPNPTFVSEYVRVNVDGSLRVARAAKEAGVARVVYFSSINVYGPGSGEKIFDETFKPNPLTDYARTKLEGERIVLGETPSVVLRLSAVYGPRMVGNYLRLLKMLRKRSVVMIGNGMNRRTLVHVSDVCSAALAAAEEPGAAGNIYNVTDGAIHTLKDVIIAMCEAVGKHYPPVQLPKGVTRGLLGFYEDLAGLIGIETSIGRSSIDKFTEDMAVWGQKLQTDTAYRPQMDLRTGWASTVGSLSL